MIVSILTDLGTSMYAYRHTDSVQMPYMIYTLLYTVLTMKIEPCEPWGLTLILLDIERWFYSITAKINVKIDTNMFQLWTFIMSIRTKY